ncbi:MAG: hypothetical protein COT91_03395, partial [Candidatus Doudnabacteria bacterium CG10_big_fil_rev_8_21_14_0_10_41_10]
RTVNIKLKANEKRIFPFFWDGKKSEEIRVNAVLDKPGSSLKLLGLFFGNKNHLELRTNVIHKAPNTFSRTIVKGVLDGMASANFEGDILIEKGAKNADADLKEHAILLSKQAKALAILRLDVLENEVKASHGATVGKIDGEQIFYLMSRGLTEAQAKGIIIKGFLGAVLQEFPEKKRIIIAKKLYL